METQDTKSFNYFLLGFCGPSCSGKTEACQRIVKILRKEEVTDITVISQDRYYFGGNKDTNYDVPEAINFDRLILDLQTLLRGKPIQAPIYDFITNSPKKETDRIYPSKIIIVEGILIFHNPILRRLFDLKVFVNAKDEIRLNRRVKRDSEERGRTIEEIKTQYERDVVPSYLNYIEPTMWESDIVIMNNIEGKFIGIDILKNHIISLLSEVKFTF